MFFVCPVCQKRKDTRKKTNSTCLDCFSLSQLHQKGKKSMEEEKAEWKETVEKREGEILKVQKELERNQEDIVKTMSELESREKGIARKEIDIENKEKKEAEATLKRKRLAEEGPSGNIKRFCDLGQKRQEQLVSEAIRELKVFGRSEIEDILAEISKRVLGNDRAEELKQMKENVAFFCATHLPSLPDKSRIAAALTRGLHLVEAEEITGIPSSSISWGRHELKQGIRILVWSIILLPSIRMT